MNISIYKIASFFANFFKIRNARKFSRFLGLLSYYILKYQRKKVVNNLKLIFPYKKKKNINNITKKIFQNFSEIIYEFLMLPRFSKVWFENFIENPEIINKIRKIINKKESLISIGGHIGNWEFLAAFCTYKGINLNVISAPHLRRPDTIFFKKQRKRLKIKTINNINSASKIIRTIKNSQSIIALLADRLYTGKYEEYIIGNKKKKITNAGFRIAAKYNLSFIFPISIKLKNGKYKIIIIGPFKKKINESSKEAVKRFSAIYMKFYLYYIKKYSNQWYYFENFIK